MCILWDGQNKDRMVRKNVIERVGGEGIVGIGCERRVIEYNVMWD